MNERIRELIVELKKTVSTHRGDAVLIGYDEIEKLAELIVLECCDIFVELRTRPADLAVKDVKKHFGVEQ